MGVWQNPQISKSKRVRIAKRAIWYKSQGVKFIDSVEILQKEFNCKISYQALKQWLKQVRKDF